MSELSELRKRIGETDEKIIAAISERNDIAMRIGELKKKEGIPLRNTDVEKKVIERYRELAKNTSLSEDDAEAICKILISGSVELQSAIVRRTISKKMTIIGGAGKMGQWLLRYFRNAGADVNVVDISEGNINDAAGSDVVIVSVPIPSVASVLKEIDGVCRKDALIFDISSIKSPFVPLLREMAERRKVCSVHPMFGPSARSVSGRNVIVCDCGCKSAVSEAAELFDGGNITVTGVEDHDKLMAYVLAFAHASNIVFFTALRNSGISFEEMRKVSSTTFERSLNAAIPVSEENASLYHGIQRLNANAEEMWKVYENAVKEVKNASLSDDAEEFADLMENGRKYLKGDHL